MYGGDDRNLRRVVGLTEGIQSSPSGRTERFVHTSGMEKRVNRMGRGRIGTELRVFIPSAFTSHGNIRDIRCRFFFTLAARERHVSDAREASILVWRFDFGLGYLAEVDDNIATDSPASCTITTCFDGNGERVVLTEEDDAASEGAGLEMDTRVSTFDRDLPADVLSVDRASEGHGCDLDVAVEHF